MNTNEQREFGTLIIKNVSYKTAQNIIDNTYGSVVWADGKAYPNSDVVAEWQRQAALAHSQSELATLKQQLEVATKALEQIAIVKSHGHAKYAVARHALEAIRELGEGKEATLNKEVE